MYEDENNEYGWAMKQLMPISNFRWRKPDEDLEVSKKKIMGWKPDQEEGFILEVDLEVPRELHDHFSGYPLAPERRTVPKEWYLPYQRRLAEKLGASEDKTEKLLLTLNDEKNYVLHYRNLQLYLKLGLKLTKVHRVLSFTQKAWMKELINFKTERRSKATTDFEKDLYKLMNNSVFGKTMENLRNRVEVELVRGDEKAKIRKLVSDPLFNAWRELGDKLYGINLHKDHILFDRPIYVGMCVLDLSKLLLYEYYYSYLKPKYGDRCRLLYTDTNSLIMEIETENYYEDMREKLKCLYDQ